MLYHSAIERIQPRRERLQPREHAPFSDLGICELLTDQGYPEKAGKVKYGRDIEQETKLDNINKKHSHITLTGKSIMSIGVISQIALLVRVFGKGRAA
jgi:hypothetical protein